MSPDTQRPDILVINLDRSPDRLAFQEAQFRLLGLAFTRVPAFDGAALSEEVYQRYAHRWQRPISRSEVGCLLSHHACWRHVVATGRNALILEDDIVLAPELVAFMDRAGAIRGATAVNLETQRTLRFLSPEPLVVEGFDGWRLFELLNATAGADAYLVTPRSAARLAAGLEKRAAIADAYLWSMPHIRRLQLDPGIAVSLDILRLHYGVPVEHVRGTTIKRPRLGHLRSVMQVFRHPLIRVRRVAGQVGLAVAKLRLRGKAVRRLVPPSPTVFASYEAMKGVRHG